MNRFLLFRLHGALAAWGDIAVGEQRPSTPHPSKSIVLGLVAAALGLKREDDDAHAALRDGYGFAVRVDSAGTPLRDYHTTQYPKTTSRLHHLSTRRDELADSGNRATVLSTRDYRSDSLYVVGLYQRGLDNVPELDTLADALRRPKFTLYLGRRSCPVALPLAPRVIEAADFKAALADYDEAARHDGQQAFLEDARVARLTSGCGYYWEDGLPVGLEPLQSTPRHDQPQSRARRQFAPRTEHYANQGGKEAWAT